MNPLPFSLSLRAALVLALGFLVTPGAWAETAAKPAALSNATILIIRHAEKPEEGTGLTPAGEKRALAYVNYFASLRVDKAPLRLDHLFAAADSKNSERPRLTLQPLSRELKLPLDLRFEADDVAALAEELYRRDHGKGIVICWHHGTIPALLAELGADPARLLPDGEWPKDVFNWVIELHFDANGQIRPKHSERIVMRWAR